MYRAAKFDEPSKLCLIFPDEPVDVYSWTKNVQGVQMAVRAVDRLLLLKFQEANFNYKQYNKLLEFKIVLKFLPHYK